MNKQDFFPAGLLIGMVVTGMVGLMAGSLLMRAGAPGLPAFLGALFVNYLVARQLVVGLRSR